jgi:hypothetical protein
MMASEASTPTNAILRMASGVGRSSTPAHCLTSAVARHAGCAVAG